MNLTGDYQRDDDQFDVLSVDDLQADSCTSLPHGGLRLTVNMQLTETAPLVFTDRPECNYSSDVDLYPPAAN